MQGVLITGLKLLKRHEPCCCYGRENSRYPVTHSSFAWSWHPVAEMTILYVITFSMVWPSILRLKSSPSNYTPAWVDSSTSPSGWITGFASVHDIERVCLPLRQSLELRQECRVTHLPASSYSQGVAYASRESMVHRKR